MLALIVVLMKAIEETERRSNERSHKHHKKILNSAPNLHHKVTPYDPPMRYIVASPTYLQQTSYYTNTTNAAGTIFNCKVPPELMYIEVNFNEHIESIVFVSKTGHRSVFGVPQSTAEHREVVDVGPGKKVSGIGLRMGKFLNQIFFEVSSSDEPGFDRNFGYSVLPRRGVNGWRNCVNSLSSVDSSSDAGYVKRVTKIPKRIVQDTHRTKQRKRNYIGNVGSVNTNEYYVEIGEGRELYSVEGRFCSHINAIQFGISL